MSTDGRPVLFIGVTGFLGRRDEHDDGTHPVDNPSVLMRLLARAVERIARVPRGSFEGQLL